MNTCVFSGNLARDPETRQVGEQALTTFTLGVQCGWGEKQTTMWVRCNLWGRQKLAQYLFKGSRVTVSGELSMREYTTQDGQTRQSLELRVADLDLPPKGNGGQQGQQRQQRAQQEPLTEIDPVPF